MGAETINKGKDYIKLYSVAGHNAPRIDVNTDLLKQEVYKFIGKGKFEDGSVPKGFCHFPIESGRKHFRQLTAEDRVKKQVSGVVKYKWDNQGRRNEQLDCRVYNLDMVYAYRQYIQEELIDSYEEEEDYVMDWEDFWTYLIGNRSDKE